MIHRLKITALCALLAALFMFALPVDTVQAQPLNRWCKSVRGTQTGNTCTLSATTEATIKRSLDVAPGLTLINYGTITNEGVLGTSGTLINYGTITGGTINNLGTLINCATIDSTITGYEAEPCPS